MVPYLWFIGSDSGGTVNSDRPRGRLRTAAVYTHVVAPALPIVCVSLNMNVCA